MKKRFCLPGIFILLFALSVQCAFADDTGTLALKLNARPLETKAVIHEGSLYLPLRPVSESLGYEVKWTQGDQTVMISAKDKVILLNFKDGKMAVDDHDSYITEGPLFIKGKTYMRADFFSDHLSLQVQWDQTKGEVALNSIKENAVSIRTVKEYSETEGLKSTVQYPVLDGLENKSVQDEMNAHFKQLADQAYQEGVGNAAELAPYVREYPDMPGQCETYFNYQIKYNRNDVIGLVFQNYQYSGGAHGGTLQTSYTINLKTGIQYALKDLFQENTDYVSLISDQVKKQLEERDLAEALFEPFDKIGENQSYYLSNNGVVVYFQQYEILPYAAGIQEFTVDASSLNSLFQ
ncbi:stalk domain-containing protein [Candidatus Formimonas warabiya]|uniref:DUF3298 and DUF4163 domain-containing protein n=1 Tax=Formimonas warabiya TaxID=1761012 RepID=A0A3G1KN87_FORW1|nr:DUF3298 domain-containing protein [Candidatus Formimonas warabiya]ATW23575.1 hypothetical protein DCMF_01080 [Candidatus Formimonas warabiya]